MSELVPWRNRGEVAPRGEHPLQQLRRDFDTLFDRLWGGFLAPAAEDAGAGRHWGLDVQEDDKELVVRADMPGFEEKELDLQVANDVLTIKAEKENKDENQREYRRFQRSFTLPPGTDPDKIQASYRSGVLELHIPRSEEARPRRISLKPGGGEQPSPNRGKETAPKAKS